jgi:pimeloyl-ACP methyl ester carboxylesterase
MNKNNHGRALNSLLALLLLALSAGQSLQAAELIQHTVMADGHPMAVWEKSADNAQESILLVHGLTWSAIPDFDLQVEGEDLSLMDGLVDEGYATYAIDLRGYGQTPRDDTGWLTPDRTARDLKIVLEWIALQKDWAAKPHLFGWSLGSTRSQLLAQRHPELISSLTLYGYWLDDDEVFPKDEEDIVPKRETNTAENAASDFITPGSISQKAIDTYVAEALKADPIKADLKGRDDYNELDPSKVTTPTLIIRGEHDPVAPPDRQAKLYMRLGTGHKQWITVPNSDHAAHLESPRPYFIHALVSFLESIPE